VGRENKSEPKPKGRKSPQLLTRRQGPVDARGKKQSGRQPEKEKTGRTDGDGRGAMTRLEQPLHQFRVRTPNPLSRRNARIGWAKKRSRRCQSSLARPGGQKPKRRKRQKQYMYYELPGAPATRSKTPAGAPTKRVKAKNTSGGKASVDPETVVVQAPGKRLSSCAGGKTREIHKQRNGRSKTRRPGLRDEALKQVQRTKTHRKKFGSSRAGRKKSQALEKKRGGGGGVGGFTFVRGGGWERGTPGG